MILMRVVLLPIWGIRLEHTLHLLGFGSVYLSMCTEAHLNLRRRT